MSTYYYFWCKKCDRTGGFLSRQAWGWGNFDIIDSFKFLALHIGACGEEYIGMVSEHSDRCYKEGNRVKFLEKTKDYWPYSNDWHTEEWPAFKEKWMSDEIKQGEEKDSYDEVKLPEMPKDDNL